MGDRYASPTPLRPDGPAEVMELLHTDGAVTAALTLSDDEYGELTGRYDNVYLRWQTNEEKLTALRCHINSRPIGEADDLAVLARFDQQTARARALRAELADLVIARHQWRGNVTGHALDSGHHMSEAATG
jgi:hypothetical protein